MFDVGRGWKDMKFRWPLFSVLGSYILHPYQPTNNKPSSLIIANFKICTMEEEGKRMIMRGREEQTRFEFPIKPWDESKAKSEVKQCVANGKCTLPLTKRIGATPQIMYECRFCGDKRCCEACAKVCHAGHEELSKKYIADENCQCGMPSTDEDSDYGEELLECLLRGEVSEEVRQERAVAYKTMVESRKAVAHRTARHCSIN